MTKMAWKKIPGSTVPVPASC